MSHCAQLQVNGYSGGFNADELAEASYVRSPRSPNVFLSKSPRATSFNAADYLFEGLNAYVIGGPKRFSNVNALFTYTSYRVATFTSHVTEPEWLRAVNDASSPVDMDGIAVTIQAVSKVIHEFGANGLKLSKVSRLSPSPQHMVALLRTTYPFRNEVRGWSDLRDFAMEYLPTRGYKPESVMRGLLA